METMVIKILEFLKGQSIQVAIVFIAVLMLTWLLRNKSAHIRYLLWLLVAIKCLTPPLVIFSVPVLPAKTVSVVISAGNPDIEYQPVQTAGQQTTNTAITVSPIEKESQSQVSIEERKSSIENPLSTRFPLTSTSILLSLWAAGAACYLLWALGKAIRLQLRLKQIRKALPPELMIEQIEKLSQLWNYPDGFKVWLVNGITQPFVWGLWRGAIYLPTRFQNIQGDKQKAIVLHEMAHVVRFDAFINLIQILIQGVFWFHPLVWLANKAIRQEREKCCDEIAVARLGTAPKEYGSAIVDTLLQEAQSAIAVPTLAVAGPVKNIEDRIKTIMQPGRKFFRKPSVIALLCICCLAAFVVPTTIALTHKVTPPDYTLSGIVSDAQTEKPIAGAIVFDDGYGPEPYQKGITDDTGKFEYKSWNEEHNITAKADGYQPQTQVFTTFPLDNSKNLNFKLQPRQGTADTAKSAFTAAMPDGVTAELVGVCEYPSEGKSWWSPDGTLLSEAPYATTGNTEKHDKEGYQNYEFALRLNWPDETSYYWMIPGGSFGSDTGSPKDREGQQIRELKSYQTGLPKEQKTAIVRLGVTAGEWKTVATQKSGDKEQTLTIGEYSIAFGIPYAKDNQILLPVVHNYNRREIIYAVRVVAITISGELRQSGYSGRGGNTLDNLTCIFNDLPLSTIKEFQFQIRPYEWITFKNVSLCPGQKTDVKIETPSATVPVEALSQREKDRLAAMGQMRHAALCCIMFADDNNGRLPTSLEQIKPYLKEESLPLDKMEYLQADRKIGEIKRVPTTALLRMQLDGGKDGAVVAYCDGHAEYFTPERMKTSAYPKTTVASTLEFRVVPEMNKDVSENDLKKYKDILEAQGPDSACDGYKWIAADTSNNATWHKTLPNHLYQDTAYVLLCDQPDKRMLADGTWGLQKVSVDTTNQQNPAIMAEFDDAGASLFGELTKQNLGKGIAIIVDGKALSAPRVQSPISRQAVITGRFTNEEVAALAQALIKGMPPMGALKKSQKPLSVLPIPAGASPRVANAFKTISDLMMALDTADQKGQTSSAEVFNQINEQCDNLEGKNGTEMPDVTEWGKLPSRLTDILELLHKIEETAEGCRSLSQGNYADMLKQHWQILKDYYNQLSMFLTPRSNNL